MSLVLRRTIWIINFQLKFNRKFFLINKHVPSNVDVVAGGVVSAILEMVVAGKEVESVIISENVNENSI